MSEKKQAEKARRVAVLTRFPGQKIVVNRVVFRVLKIDRQKLSIHIEAPEDATIDRPTKEEDAVDRIRSSSSAEWRPSFGGENKKKR